MSMCLRCGGVHDICGGVQTPRWPHVSVRDIPTTHIVSECPCGDCRHRRFWESLFAGPSKLDVLRYPPRGDKREWVEFGAAGRPEQVAA